MKLFSALAVGLLGMGVLCAAEEEFPSKSGKNVSPEKEFKRSGSQSSYTRTHRTDGDLSFLSGINTFVNSTVATAFATARESTSTVTVQDGDSTVTMVNGKVVSISRPPTIPLITGSGKILKKLWYLGETQRLTGIQATGIGSLEILRGTDDDTQDTITVTADDNVFDALSVSLSEEDLLLCQKKDYRVDERTPVVYTVRLRPATLALLTSIRTRLATTIKAPLNTEVLTLASFGTGSITAEETLKVESSIELEQASTGSMTLSNVVAGYMLLNKTGKGLVNIARGDVPLGVFTISGAGPIRAKGLALRWLNLNHYGSGSLVCNVTRDIRGSLTRTCSVSNYGAGNAKRLIICPAASYERVTSEE